MGIFVFSFLYSRPQVNKITVFVWYINIPLTNFKIQTNFFSMLDILKYIEYELNVFDLIANTVRFKRKYEISEVRFICQRLSY